MNLLWRFIWVILFSRFSQSVGVMDQSSIHFRVLPTDIDVLMHMNNGRYLSLLDLARVDCMIRNKTFASLKKYKIYPVVASEMIRFRKSLNLFQRFEITTQIQGWDDKFIYIVHQFKRQHRMYALAVVKARMLHADKGAMSPNEVLNQIGLTLSSPVLPEWVKQWQAADQEFYEVSIKNNNE